MGGQVMCFVKGIEAILFLTILKFLLFFPLFTSKKTKFYFCFSQSVEQRQNGNPFQKWFSFHTLLLHEDRSNVIIALEKDLQDRMKKHSFKFIEFQKEKNVFFFWLNPLIYTHFLNTCCPGVKEIFPHI